MVLIGGGKIMSFVDECDRRIRAAQRRLEKTPEENNRTTALVCFLSFSLLPDYKTRQGV